MKEMTTLDFSGHSFTFVKKVPWRLLRRTSNMFLFNCEPGRVDHGDLKDSNFEDDRQPEIAVWPPNRKYLYLRNYDRCHQNSNGKRRFFERNELEEGVPGRLQ